MDQFNFVKKFNEDIDSILAGNPQASPKELPQTEYDDMLNLAAVLAETDLSPESRKKQILRRRLLNRCLAQKTNNKEAIMKNIFRKHRPALLACSFAMVAILGFFMIFPGTLTAMANTIGNILKLGPYVTLISNDELPEPSTKTSLTSEQQEQLDKNGYVKFEDENGNLITIGTWAKPPVEVETVNYSSLADAQEGVSYKLLSPTYLPEGYSFKNAECFKESKEYITLKFQGPGKDIILMQRLMNEQTQYVSSGGVVEPVTINGNDGAWADSSLTWQIGDVNYILFAKEHSKDETMKIAESVK